MAETQAFAKISAATLIGPDLLLSSIRLCFTVCVTYKESRPAKQAVYLKKV